MQQVTLNVDGMEMNLVFTGLNHKMIPSFVSNKHTSTPVEVKKIDPMHKHLSSVFDIADDTIPVFGGNLKPETINGGRSIALAVRNHFRSVGAHGYVESKTKDPIYAEFYKQRWGSKIAKTKWPGIWFVTRKQKTNKRKSSI
jgi:hypothetical protein